MIILLMSNIIICFANYFMNYSCRISLFTQSICKELALSQSEYTSILKCTPWLAKFLARRGLKQPDHRPLYEYHATCDEYDELKRMLRAIGLPDGYKVIKGTQPASLCSALSGTEGITSEIVDGRGNLFIKLLVYRYLLLKWEYNP